MACLFGHKWNGCKCEKCGKTRDAEHRFRQVEGRCEKKCEVCGAVTEEHEYVHGVCKRCGKQLQTPFHLEFTKEENGMLGQALAAFYMYLGGEDVYSMLAMLLSKLNVFEGCEKSDALRADVRELLRSLPSQGAGSVDWTLPQIETAQYTAQKVREKYIDITSKPAEEGKDNSFGRNCAQQIGSAADKIDEALRLFRAEVEKHT